jgi:hypothetical protein
MSLSFRERRQLGRIGRTAGRSDPRLAAMLAIFGRLTATEPMPRHEHLRPPPGEAEAVRHDQPTPANGLRGRLGSWLRSRVWGAGKHAPADRHEFWPR